MIRVEHGSGSIHEEMGFFSRLSSLLGRARLGPIRATGMEDVYLPHVSQKRLLRLARDTLEGFVRRNAQTTEPVEDAYLQAFDFGAFVSLHKGGELRGCIGTCFPTRPLYETVIEMTEAAASRDYRVSPIYTEELPEVRIDISVLSPLWLAADPLALEVGKHGLHVACDQKCGVLLPQVATQYGWDMMTFLEQACIKAGLPKRAWRWPQTQISTFSALIIEEEK